MNCFHPNRNPNRYFFSIRHTGDNTLKFDRYRRICIPIFTQAYASPVGKPTNGYWENTTTFNTQMQGSRRLSVVASHDHLRLPKPSLHLCHPGMRHTSGHPSKHTPYCTHCLPRSLMWLFLAKWPRKPFRYLATITPTEH